MANKPGLAYKRHVLRSALKSGVEKGSLVTAANHKNSFKLGAAVKKAAVKAAKYVHE